MAFDATKTLQQAHAARRSPEALRQVLIDLIQHIDELSPTEIAYIDGVTAGTGLASKALVLDSSGNVAMPDGGYINLSVAAPAAAGSGQSTYTAIADQINAVTGADGTKGVALPAASAGRAIYIDNTVQTAVLKVSPVNGGDDQINALTAGTGVFTMGPGQAAWFIPTAAAKWYVSGHAAIVGTPTEQDMDGLTASVAELNYNDITTLGTAQASKTVTADANVDVTSLRNVTATGTIQGATLTATGALNAGGTVLVGVTTTDTLGFFGAAGAVRRAAAAQVTVTATVTASGNGFGFVTEAAAVALVDAVAEIQHVLTTHGLWKGAA